MPTPDPPSMHTPTNITSTSVDLAVTNGSGHGGTIDTNQFRIRRSFGDANPLYDSTGGTALTFSNLDPYTTYYADCQSEVGAGAYSDFSPAVQFSTLAAYPSAPTANSCVATSSTSIEFTDTLNTGNNYAPVLERQIGYGTDGTTPQTFKDTNGDITVSGLNKYTTYYFWSRVRNARGWSNWSNRLSATTGADNPHAPTPKTPFNLTQVSVQYKFTDPSDTGGAPIDQRQIGWGTDSNSVTNTMASVGDDVVTGLNPFTTYYLWSRVHTVSGWGPWSARTTIKTIAGALIKVGNVWKQAVPYVNVAGTWHVAQPYSRVWGVWTRSS